MITEQDLYGVRGHSKLDTIVLVVEENLKGLVSQVRLPKALAEQRTANIRLSPFKTRMTPESAFRATKRWTSA